MHHVISSSYTIQDFDCFKLYLTERFCELAQYGLDFSLSLGSPPSYYGGGPVSVGGSLCQYHYLILTILSFVIFYAVFDCLRMIIFNEKYIDYN